MGRVLYEANYHRLSFSLDAKSERCMQTQPYLPKIQRQHAGDKESMWIGLITVISTSIRRMIINRVMEITFMKSSILQFVHMLNISKIYV